MSKNVTIGDKQLVIKPALLVLIGAVLLGSLAPLFAKRVSAQPSLVWKCSNLDLWKFEVRRQAQAELALSPTQKQSLSKSSTKAAYNLDMTTGVEVDIKQNDGAADCVDLRNAINFEEIKQRKGLVLRFTARADQPHAVNIILRERDQLRWSGSATLSPQWSEFNLPISFQSCASNQAILALHLGGATGKIGLKNLRIEQAN
jgi:hypothetical protein